MNRRNGKAGDCQPEDLLGDANGLKFHTTRHGTTWGQGDAAAKGIAGTRLFNSPIKQSGRHPATILVQVLPSPHGSSKDGRWWCFFIFALCLLLLGICFLARLKTADDAAAPKYTVTHREGRIVFEPKQLPSPHGSSKDGRWWCFPIFALCLLLLGICFLARLKTADNDAAAPKYTVTHREGRIVFEPKY